MNTIKAKILVLFIIIFLALYKPVHASPPPWIGDPNCNVSGVIINIENKFSKGTRGQAYEECLKPYTTITDCEFILPAGQDKNYVEALVLVNTSSSDQSIENSKTCAKLYPTNKEYSFTMSKDIQGSHQLNKGDTIFGEVRAPGEFISLQKETNKALVIKNQINPVRRTLFLIGIVTGIGLFTFYIMIRKKPIWKK